MSRFITDALSVRKVSIENEELVERRISVGDAENEVTEGTVNVVTSALKWR